MRSESICGQDALISHENTLCGYIKAGRHTLGLVNEVEDVGVVAGLDGALVIVLCAFEHLCEGVEVHAEGHGAVTAVFLEPGRLEPDRDEGDVRVVHRLESLCREPSRSE